MKKMRGDVRVIGMVAGNHVIEDIGRDVAFRTLVVIPEDQALISKDLWRAISQGFLCQVPSAPYPSGTAGAPQDPDKARLEKYTAQLEALAARLQTENEALKRQLDGSAHAHSAKLDEILKAIQSGVAAAPAVGVAPPVAGAPAAKPVEEVVDGSAPTFLPAEIRSKDLDARINIQGEESTSDAVTEAADLLRQLRKKERSP
jgi:hypothetical protein